MIAEQWHLGLVVVALASNLLFAVVLYVYGRGHDPERPDSRVGDLGDSSSGAERADVGQEIVTCPDCAAENERGYRYCRACVTELPAADRHGRRADRPLQRLT
jgi:hypothetical protein